MFALVRHGHAGHKDDTDGADELRPLSERGQQQARGLVVSLAGLDPTRLVSGSALRCRQTMLPLATSTRKRVEPCALLDAGADVAELARELQHPRYERAVLCTHGETITALLRLWRSAGRLEISANGSTAPGRTGTEKGAAWLVVGQGSLLHAEYVRPLHVGPVLHDTPGEPPAG